MADDKIWYIALDDEQVGPLSEDEVRAEIGAGNVNAETFVWRDGMADWMMAEEVSEFAAIIDGDAPDLADVAGQSVDAFFAAQDAMSTEASAQDQPESSFAPSGVAVSPVASRSDDSVLFSLDELAGSTSASTAPEPETTDGSGLIDLSALAASASTGTAASTARPAATSGGFAATSGSHAAAAASAPAVVALAPSKKSMLPIILMIVGGIVILGLLVAILLLLNKKDDAPVAQEPATTDVATQEGTQEAANEDAKTADAEDDAEVDADADADADGESDEPEAPEAPEAPEQDTKAADKKAAGSAATKKSEPAAKPAAKEAAAPAPKSTASSSSSSTKKAEPKKESGDSVSAALAAIGSGAKKEEESAPSAASSGSKTLTDSQIRSTVRRYNSKVQACKGGPDDAGTYRVAFAIETDGHTSMVTPRDSGPVAQCVANVVSHMRFPTFEGAPRKLTYTFPIR